MYVWIGRAGLSQSAKLLDLGGVNDAQGVNSTPGATCRPIGQ